MAMLMTRRDPFADFDALIRRAFPTPRSEGEAGPVIDFRPAAEITRSMRKPDLKGNPLKVWAAVNIQDGILSLLPEWALLLFGIEGRPMNLRAAARVTRRLVTAAVKGRSSADLIAEVAGRVEEHPYRKVRRPKN